MNRTVLVALMAATALSGGVAWAEPKDERGGGPKGREQQAPQGQGQKGPAEKDPGQKEQGQRPAPAQQQRRPEAQRQPQAQSQPRPQKEPQIRREPQPQARPQPERHPPAPVMRQPERQAQPSLPDQGRPKGQSSSRPQAQTQGDRQGGRFSYRGREHDRIQAPRYSYPEGYGYRRWGVGQSLPLLFLSSPFFFDNYSDYGFGSPPYGYHWVRYGPDLLLVSDRTGAIRDVIYGVFY